MGGAGVAHPLDAIGAIHWNPATITSFSGTSVSMGVDFFMPSSELSSTTTAGAIGGVFPPIDLSGTTEAERKVFLIPSGAFVHHKAESRFAYGVGAFAIAGFGVEYPEDPTNPVISPQPFGFGHLQSKYQALQIVPTVAYKVTKRISVGIAPTLTWHSFSLEPFLIGPRDNYAGTGVPIARPGEHKASGLGVGVQAGVYYVDPSGLELGFSYKSPLAFKRLEYEYQDASGRPQTQYFPVDYPSILSVGVGYRGPGRWGFAADVRYIDYDGLNGFETLPLGPRREIRGLGWRSIWATAMGVSYTVNSSLSLRGGYSYADRAMPDEVALYNVASPTLVRHKAAGGLGYKVTESMAFHFTYTHNFEGTLKGPRFGPGTPSTLGTVEAKASGNGFLFGLSKTF
jgi:long-chain fatty acid transport protein